MSYKNNALKNLPIFTGKNLCWSLFLNENAGPQRISMQRLQHRCFPVNIVKFLRTPVFINTCEQLFESLPT